MTSKTKTIITTSALRGDNKILPEKTTEEAEGTILDGDHILKPSIATVPTYRGKPIVVVIPSWNCKRWLLDAFDSLAVQSLDRERWGVLLIDDGSTDNTASLCRRYGVEHVRMNQQHGKAYALNFASRMLEPETIIAELDADDSLEPTAMEEMLAAWEAAPDAVMIYSNYYSYAEDLRPLRKGHCKEATTDIEDAGWISHLKTYRARDLIAAGGLDEEIRKSIDKDLVYRLQELSERTGRAMVHVPQLLYRYRRRKKGSITEMKHYDATLARRRAIKRRTGILEDVVCVWSASEANESGGPGIFWGRLLAEIGKHEKIHMVEHLKDADVVLGNVHMPQIKRHDRPWILRIDGIHFDSRQDYATRNAKIAEGLHEAEGVIYQGAWGKEMVDEYCGEVPGKWAVIRNGADPPEGWKKNKKVDRKIILACSRWGTKTPRRFKRLEETIEGFQYSKLGDKGYTLVVAGDHYMAGDSTFGNAVRFTGRITSEEVWGFLAEAAAVVHLSWFDCCPNTIIEAMAAKVPVVYCAEGAKEIIGLSAGEPVPDSPVNHPCDISKPPTLDIPLVAEAMIEAVSAPRKKDDFPDVSMKICADNYMEFILEIDQAGRMDPPEAENEEKTPIVFDTAGWT